MAIVFNWKKKMCIWFTKIVFHKSQEFWKMVNGIYSYGTFLPWLGSKCFTVMHSHTNLHSDVGSADIFEPLTCKHQENCGVQCLVPERHRFTKLFPSAGNKSIKHYKKKKILLLTRLYTCHPVQTAVELLIKERMACLY